MPKIRSFFKDNNIDIALLKETKMENRNQCFYRSLGGLHFSHSVCLLANNSSRGQLDGWHDIYIILLQFVINVHLLHFIFLDLNDNSILNVTNVYGSNCKEERRVLCKNVLILGPLLLAFGWWVVALT